METEKAARRTKIPLRRGLGILFLVILFVQSAQGRQRSPYYGRPIGEFTNYAHRTQGYAFAVDESTVFIKGFYYDGTGPDAYFWAGDSARPSPDGFIIPYPERPKGRDPVILGKYEDADILLKLPGGKKLKDINWISVWCRRFTVNFGDVRIPAGLDPPRARVLPEFKRLAHGLRSGNITVLDAKTFYIPNLHYDGAGPDAYFWVGNGSEPTTYGIKVPSETGSLDPLRGYQGEDIEIQLPGNLTVYDIDWLAVYCIRYAHNFGHVYIPRDLDVPPALGQTKITTSTSTNQPTPDNVVENCREMLDQKLQIRWELQGDIIQITLKARIRDDQYMAFGISGVNGKARMIGSDVVVTYWDKKTNTPHAVDYFISHLAQCDGLQGACPDTRIGGNDDVMLVSGNRENGVTTVTYRRPLDSGDKGFDRHITSDRPVSVIAAIGPLNSRNEVNAHTAEDKNAENVEIDFGSYDDNNCIGLADFRPDDLKPWKRKVLVDVKNMTVRIGPTAGKRGYETITGHPSWGIVFYINDLLLPIIYVQRGKIYQFTIETGNNPTNPARYHPFYISDSPEGGYGQMTQAMKKTQEIFAGIGYDDDGDDDPTGLGRYCEWVHNSVDKSATSETFEDYMKTLHLECEPGNPGTLIWNVTEITPDMVYYQCYTHKNLGWKIYVVPSNVTIEEYAQTHLQMLGEISNAAAASSNSYTLSFLNQLAALITIAFFPRHN